MPNNGAYCARIVKICKYLGRAVVDLAVPEDQPTTAAIVEAALADDPAITHVGAGALRDRRRASSTDSPASRASCAQRGKGLIVDAMSSFGALPIDVKTIPFDALVARQRQVPRGRARHGVRDREEARDRGLRGQFALAGAGSQRPVRLHAEDDAVALHAADARGRRRATRRVEQFIAEGGQPARLARYADNCRTLVEGMQRLGFRAFLKPAVQAPIIVTFHAPADPRYDFKTFYAAVRERGYILYPGKLTQVETFRVGCIGAIDANEMRNVVTAVEQCLRALRVTVGPIAAAA